jgi:hypothetical protein
VTDPDQKFRAKRGNEHVKSVYNLVNTLAAAIIVTAFLVPYITTPTKMDLDARGWVLIALALHGFGHFAIWRYMRRED